MEKFKLAIIGAGNIGVSLARGLVSSKKFNYDEIILTKKNPKNIEKLTLEGFTVTRNNKEAIQKSEIILIAVEPEHINGVLEDIKNELKSKQHIIISVVSNVKINNIKQKTGKNISVVRAMPNTATIIGESMTCLCMSEKNEKILEKATNIFKSVGEVVVIDEENMVAATALGACGIAFFLRAIRAASQGGIEIGFHSDIAIKIAAQTAKGAAQLLLQNQKHPEYEIDKVTTPRGVTISGLNEMEHQGFSSAMIKGIVTSAEKASNLFKK